MRVYIPVTVADVERRRSEGYWTIPTRRAWAVNRQLALALPDEDEEEREFIASLTAANASASRLAIAADVPPTMLGDEGVNGEVDVAGMLRTGDIACLLRVDPDDDEQLLWFAPTEFDEFLGL